MAKFNRKDLPNVAARKIMLGNYNFNYNCWVNNC